MNRTLPLILTAALLLTACASAVPAQPADDAVFRKVDAPNPDYKLTKKKSTSANWV